MKEIYPDSPYPPYFKGTKENEGRNPKRRCANQSKRISWCRLKKRFCNSPSEYETCPDYTDPQERKTKRPC